MAQSQISSEKASKKRKSKANLSTIFSQTTIRHLTFAYLHLTLASPSTLIKTSVAPTPPIDLITVRTHLTSALTQFLGLTGSTIPVDILKVEERDAWIRVPFEDKHAVVEALSGWTGNDVTWRIRESGSWLGGMVGSNGYDLFGD
ncbi:hypothetical protein MMC10_007885 [Thelotrema lepadinum]|nr:hypothetical protein [Thelotrema lepadinum]